MVECVRAAVGMASLAHRMAQKHARGKKFSARGVFARLLKVRAGSPTQQIDD
jgi:hypothetical protein